MSPSVTRPTRRRTRSLVALAVAAVTTASVLVASGAADAGSFAANVQPPPASPTSASQIQNIDQVKTAIKAYYGDTPSNVLDPVNGTVTLHFASPTSAYANEMSGIESKAGNFLAAHNTHHSATEAIVLDVDDSGEMTPCAGPAERSAGHGRKYIGFGIL